MVNGGSLEDIARREMYSASRYDRGESFSVISAKIPHDGHDISPRKVIVSENQQRVSRNRKERSRCSCILDEWRSLVVFKHPRGSFSLHLGEYVTNLLTSLITRTKLARVIGK